MKKLTLLCVAVAAFTLLGAAPRPAEASDFGLHFAGPGYHVDVGRPHYRSAYYGGYYGGRGSFDEGYYRGGRAWHDTSHYDYHPGEHVRHYNHYHYVPGHYDYHESGHWDHHGW